MTRAAPPSRRPACLGVLSHSLAHPEGRALPGPSNPCPLSQRAMAASSPHTHQASLSVRTGCTALRRERRALGEGIGKNTGASNGALERRRQGWGWEATRGELCSSVCSMEFWGQALTTRGKWCGMQSRKGTPTERKRSPGCSQPERRGRAGRGLRGRTWLGDPAQSHLLPECPLGSQGFCTEQATPPDRVPTRICAYYYVGWISTPKQQLSLSLSGRQLLLSDTQVTAAATVSVYTVNTRAQLTAVRRQGHPREHLASEQPSRNSHRGVS